jgi:RNA polymerase sigma-70 factor (ECF subfamily)
MEYLCRFGVMLKRSSLDFDMSEGPKRSEFGQAALEHLDAVYGFAMTLTRNQTEAEDLVQETYLRAVRAFGQLMPDSNLKSWLFAIARNAWLNQLRHARRRPRFVELDAEDEEPPRADHPSNDPHLVYLQKLEREEVHAAIESLPLLHREMIVLRDIEGFSYQQIAVIVGCPAGTVMSRLGRAREKLRRLLREVNKVTAAKTARASEV